MPDVAVLAGEFIGQIRLAGGDVQVSGDEYGEALHTGADRVTARCDAVAGPVAGIEIAAIGNFAA